MAFPTIPTTGANTLLSSTTSTASTTHTFPNLTTLAPAAGDLIIAICVQYEGDTSPQFSSWGASLTEIADNSTTGTGNGALGVAYKSASGSESGTFTVTSVESWKSVNFLMRIPAGQWNSATAPEVQAATRAAGAAADPASFNPTNWDAEDTLWIAVGAHTETSTTGSPPTLDSPPTNYSGQLIVARAADTVGDITAGVAFRQLNASSDDVGTWTTSNATRGNGIASVITVRPSGDRTISASGASASATGSASLVHIPTLLVPSAFGASTADGLVSLPKLDIINPAASATAAVGTIVIAIAQSRLIDLTGIVSSATASVSTPLVLVTITSPVAQATASSVEPVVASLVESVVATATASSTAQLPLVTVDAVAISTASAVAPSVGTLAVVVSVSATATASTLDPLPLLTIATVATANAAIVSPYIDAGLPPVNYANVLIFGN